MSPEINPTGPLGIPPHHAPPQGGTGGGHDSTIGPDSGGGGGGSTGGGGSGGSTGGGSTGGGSTGGTVTSSGNYTVVSQRHTVQQLSSGNVIDVESVGFQTKPHGVYCEVLVPFTDWQAGNSATYINPVATAIETIMGGQPVASASFTQDVDTTSNLLANFVDFIVVYTAPGGIAAMTTTVRVSVTSLTQGAAGLPTQQIQAAYASLQRTAGL